MKTTACFVMSCPARLLLAVIMAALVQFSAQGDAPFVHTQAASLITTSNATLNGMAVPNGEPTIAWFEWGPRGSYGQTTSPTNIGTGTAVVRVSAPVAGLVSRGLYQYRLVSSNAAGLVAGAMELFTTGDKLSSWGGSGINRRLPPGLSNITQISTGYRALALRSGGTIFDWEIATGQIFTNTTAVLSNIVAVAGASLYYAALTAEGGVYRWATLNPTPLAGASNIISIAVGSGSGAAGVGAALSSEGNVTTWSNTALPRVPQGLSNVVAVACGASYVLALKANGTLTAWGAISLYGVTNIPSGLTNVVKISSGPSHWLALRNDGLVFAWGSNFSGQTNVPAGLSNVVAVSAGDSHSAVLKADGTIVVWGRNITGQTNVPAGLTNVATINAGGVAGLIFAICNRPPEGGPALSSGYPNHDLVMQLPTLDNNNDDTSTRVMTLPASGSLYQHVAGNRGGQITVTDTPVTDPANWVIFVPETNSIGSPYATFTFLADDGESVSVPATATVNIVLPTAPQLGVATSEWFGDGIFNLNFSGTASATYRVWASTNLMDWEVLGAATATSNGWYNFLDFGATNSQQRFYRAGAP